MKVTDSSGQSASQQFSLTINHSGGGGQQLRPGNTRGSGRRAGPGAERAYQSLPQADVAYLRAVLLQRPVPAQPDG
jgi:hypothetical protein